MRYKFATFRHIRVSSSFPIKILFLYFTDNSSPHRKEKERALKKARRDISSLLDLLVTLAISTFVRASEFLGYIIGSFCGAAHTLIRADTYVCTLSCARSFARLHAAYVLQACWTKLWPVSIGRALRVVYRSTFWSCNTRPDTDRRGCAAAETRGEPVGPGIAQAT